MGRDDIHSELHLYCDEPPFKGRLMLHELANAPLPQIEDFLSRITYLTLVNTPIPWTSRAYHGLVELDFRSDVDGFIEIGDFAMALRASPRLRVLKLEQFHLDPNDELSLCGPILLEHLEILFLRSIDTKTAERLLRLIQPGSKPLYMKCQSAYHAPSFEPYIQFLRRSRVAKLMIRCFHKEVFPDALLTVLPAVDHLLVEGFTLNAACFESMASPTVHCDDEYMPTFWPRLRTLHLFNCHFYRNLLVSEVLLAPPIRFSFMMFCSSCRFWDTDPKGAVISTKPVSYDSYQAQALRCSIEAYIPGFQRVSAVDSPYLADAWAMALDY
ncbi:carbohydrate esterase family 16 protein [Ceratobasidium sp. AG-Ba]|nr:carbohydrate esterase family 16 protein [Ceratobasidium sp. AG-Ba]